MKELLNWMKGLGTILVIGIGFLLTSVLMFISHILTGIGDLIRKVPVEIWSGIILLIIMAGIIVCKIWIG